MHTNRLANEKSPYLLQHAHNPVDWFPWGEEAFQKAQREDKPIFLSVGYSTCHWCHVMERESFENEDTAAVVNRHFVPVKVDREERPDVDRIYMAFVQATTQRGGWPMSVFLTPDLKPFYGGTYFPPDSRYGMPGFKGLLEFLAVKWREEREKIQGVGIDTINQLESMLSARMEGEGNTTVDRGSLDKLFYYLRRNFDSKYGGFSGRPKFPRPVVHDFLLRYYDLAHTEDALEMVSETLKEMAKGGMNDQLGGGFHRYSVDERWFVPHFEKMLYDQAQLAISYLETYQLNKDEFHAGIAADIFEYVLRDMRHPEGGFYSAEDADSVIDPANPKEKGEGAFYVWSKQELAELLTPEEAAEITKVYGVEDNGNVEEDPHHEFTGKNIFYVAKPSLNAEILDSAQKKLLAARSTRIRPHLDDKVLTAWNGLMISAFAKGATVLNEPRYLDAAVRATHFILKRLYQPENARLLRRFRDGESAIEGFLDDYAFFGNALLDLYSATFDPYHFELAVQIAGRMIELFEDPEAGGFFSTREGDPSLVLRLKEDYDGAEPSGNSLAVQLLVRLSHATGRADFHESAERALQYFSGKIASQGVTMPRMVAAQMMWMRAPRQIVLAGPREHPDMQAMLRIIHSRFLPDTIVFLLDSDQTRDSLQNHASSLASMHPIDGKPSAYLCEHFACQLPVTDPKKLEELLLRSSTEQ